MSRLRDPDPGLVPLPEPKLKLTTLAGSDDGEEGVDAAVASFGRALGEVLSAQQQATEARCRSVAHAANNTTERFAWAADCLYSRH